MTEGKKLVPHKWAEVIHAWAEGHTIQEHYGTWEANKWEDAVTPCFGGSDPWDFRSKPEKQYAIPYRRFVEKYEDGSGVVLIHYKRDDLSPEDVEGFDNFHKWIDLEWQTEEV